MWVRVALALFCMVNSLVPQGPPSKAVRLAAVGLGTGLMVADALWKRAMRSRRRRAAESWPTAAGTVESTSVEASSDLLPGKRLLRAAYSYKVAGNWYSGFDDRVFKEARADDEASRLRGGRIQVRYNPQKPSDSLLLN
jgi:hypothetical protein